MPWSRVLLLLWAACTEEFISFSVRDIFAGPGLYEPLCISADKGILRLARRGGLAQSDNHKPSNPFGLWLPDELVDLQAEANTQAVFEDPLRELLRIEQAVRGVASA